MTELERSQGGQKGGELEQGKSAVAVPSVAAQQGFVRGGWKELGQGLRVRAAGSAALPSLGSQGNCTRNNQPCL